MPTEISGSTGVNKIQDGTIVDSDFATGARGLKEVDQWRLTTDFTGNATPIASNLARVDSDGYGKIGTGMSESSGIFTFPSTGVWKIEYTISTLSGSDNRYTYFSIETTLDNSSYDTAASAYASINVESSNWYGNGTISFIFDVTDVSTRKVRFKTTHAETGTTVRGSSGANETHMTFIRLGDT
nr:F5/8 type C domain protein [uncultured Mediterranean phage uvMED]